MDELFGNPDRDKSGRFMSGNKFWRIATLTAGAPRKFETPEQLYEAALGYFDWVDDNPLQEAKAFGTGHETTVDKMRPMGIRALCIHIGIVFQTFYDYEAREEFTAVCKHIKDVMTTYNYEGAVAGLLHANIIARELGLYDRMLHGNDPDNPMPEGGVVHIYEIPDNGRD